MKVTSENNQDLLQTKLGVWNKRAYVDVDTYSSRLGRIVNCL